MTDDTEAGTVAPEPACAICDEAIYLGDGRRLTVRHSSVADADGLESLYRRLSPDDLRRRFFTGGLPPPRFFDRWASVAERGGFGLVAELTGDGRGRLVGEAGYAPIPDGRAGGELGIAVDPGYRGWLGPWLLDSLLRHARERGVATLQALVLVENKAMMALLAKRGLATAGHPDWNTVQVVIATDDSVPSWGPEHARPRILIETDRSRWRGEEAFRKAGADLMVCSGLYREGQRCPVLHGETCPLIADADAVIVDVPDDDIAADLVHSERLLHPGVRFVAGRRGGGDDREGATAPLSPEELLTEIEDLLDRADRDSPEGGQ